MLRGAFCRCVVRGDYSTCCQTRIYTADRNAQVCVGQEPRGWPPVVALRTQTRTSRIPSLPDETVTNEALESTICPRTHFDLLIVVSLIWAGTVAGEPVNCLQAISAGCRSRIPPGMTCHSYSPHSYLPIASPSRRTIKARVCARDPLDHLRVLRRCNLAQLPGGSFRRNVNRG